MELQNLEIEGRRHAAEIQHLEMEGKRQAAELQHLELEGKRQAILDVAISASRVAMPGDEIFVEATVEIRNVGTRNTRIDLSEQSPFAVRPVTFGADGLPRFGEPVHPPVVRADDPELTSRALVIRAAGREVIPFMFRVPGPGVYFLTFAARLSENEDAVAREAGATNRTRWVGKRFVTVA